MKVSEVLTNDNNSFLQRRLRSRHSYVPKKKNDLINFHTFVRQTVNSQSKFPLFDLYYSNHLPLRSAWSTISCRISCGMNATNFASIQFIVCFFVFAINSLCSIQSFEEKYNITILV